MAPIGSITPSQAARLVTSPIYVHTQREPACDRFQQSGGPSARNTARNWSRATAFEQRRLGSRLSWIRPTRNQARCTAPPSRMLCAHGARRGARCKGMFDAACQALSRLRCGAGAGVSGRPRAARGMIQDLARVIGVASGRMKAFRLFSHCDPHAKCMARNCDPLARRTPGRKIRAAQSASHIASHGVRMQLAPATPRRHALRAGEVARGGRPSARVRRRRARSTPGRDSACQAP